MKPEAKLILVVTRFDDVAFLLQLGHASITFADEHDLFKDAGADPCAVGIEQDS